MKLEIQSLGKISNASIRLDGITAIVGNNDAGKSTVGKALFTAIDAFHDFDEETGKRTTTIAIPFRPLVLDE